MIPKEWSQEEKDIYAEATLLIRRLQGWVVPMEHLRWS